MFSIYIFNKDYPNKSAYFSELCYYTGFQDPTSNVTRVDHRCHIDITKKDT